ncbi:MAG TPA: chorismate-binding protein, partial [Acidimicrobiales bacterium]
MTAALDVFREVAAAYPRCFWLDGAGAREWSGGGSTIGWLEPDDVSITYDAGRREVVRHAGGRSEVVGDDVFAVLEAELAAGSPDDLWVGYLGYACRPDLPAATGSGLPDAVWMRPSGVRYFDHGLVRGSLRLSAVATPDKRRFPRSTGDSAPASYRHAFVQVQEQLRAGNTYEVNLTYRLEERSTAAPAEVYERLRELNPAPYAGFVQHDLPGARAWLLSSSPERYARVEADRTIETRPIKGTTPRGATPDEDEAQRRRLADDAKFRAENLMIVDLLRNDLSMVCAPGTVEVPSLMAV